MAKTNFENLQVYQPAEQLAAEIWNIVRKLDFIARSTVGVQMIKAADGIGACIAEGSGRGTAMDNRRFIGIARGSLYETKHWLRRAYKRKLLRASDTTKLTDYIGNLTPALNGYRRSVSTAATKQRLKLK